MFPALSVEVDGVKQDLWVVYDKWWSKASTSDSELKYDYNNRMYLSEENSADPSKLFKPNLLGGSISFDVNLDDSGCGCVSALYGVVMPAVNHDGDPFSYCDANRITGAWCPEFDMMEANRHAFRATGHTCDAPNALGEYNNCDRGGKCHIDVLEAGTKDYGHGPLYKINTQKPFRVEQKYHTDAAGRFVDYETFMYQEDRQLHYKLNEAGCN